ncbi:MAG: hypothetical protein NXH83_03090 [Rhodobacteraceae bacterium]|nr:hypothetical protein [Paracoccaceae bacterium]
MKSTVRIFALCAPLVILAGCAGTRVSDDDLRCAGGTASGAAVGGFIGNLFGEGKGNTAMTALGAIAGGAAGANAACN